jgi:hypothetical protein
MTAKCNEKIKEHENSESGFVRKRRRKTVDEISFSPGNGNDRFFRGGNDF